MCNLDRKSRKLDNASIVCYADERSVVNSLGKCPYAAPFVLPRHLLANSTIVNYLPLLVAMTTIKESEVKEGLITLAAMEKR